MKGLGLRGSVLKEWVNQEKKICDAIAQGQERSIEAEQKEGASRAQMQERTIELEHRSLELRISLQELQNAAPTPVNVSPADNGTRTTLWKSLQRCLRTFDKKKYNLYANMMCFERLASGQLWAREHWATALSECFQGKHESTWGLF